MTNKSCLSCHADRVETLLDFGLQPPSNRYLSLGSSDSDAHSLIFGQCGECGLFQLVDPMPASMARSRHPWLTYNEPEEHLNEVVESLAAFVGKDANIIGLSYHDDSTLGRFKETGYERTFRYDMKSDLGVSDPCSGIETIQEIMDDTLAERLAAKHGKADLLIARYVLEHAHNPERFLKALGRILAPEGQLVIEIPDCRKFIAAQDYSFIWEEHISYFTPRTLTEIAAHNGFDVKEVQVYPHSLEDSLIAVMRAATNVTASINRSELSQDLELGREFANQFNESRTRYRRYFESCRKDSKRIAVFGAGHLASRFLNFFDLKDAVDCVIDDNPNKQGLAMPGSGLAIVDSSRLKEIDLCMLSLSPESEQRVLTRQQDYIKGGGNFASIFALSPLALKLS